MIAFCASGTANADPPRERADFFGINVPASHTYDDARLQSMASGVAGQGFAVTRLTFMWAHMQYTRGGAIDWSWTDERVAALARQGVRVLPSLFETPGWAVRYFDCPPTLPDEKRTKCPPADPTDFANFAGLVARRYGAGGDFWKLHDGGPGEDLIPAHPVREIEIWNEPNGEWAFHPDIEPEHYGEMYREAYYAIKWAAPSITVLAGAVAPVEISHKGWMAYPEFFDKMGLGAVEAISMHPYLPTSDAMAYHVRKLRTYMDSRGLRDKSIYLTEWGWPSEEFPGDSFRLPGLNAQPRGELLHGIVDRVSRSDCGVAQMVAFAWDTTDRWDSWGRSLSLTRPSSRSTGFDLYPEMGIFASGIAKMRGAGPVANRATVHDCDRPAPDRDEDGVQDQHDWAPLDPSVYSQPGSIAPSPQSQPYLREKFWTTGGPARTTLGTWHGAPIPHIQVVRWEHCNAAATDCESIPYSATQSLTIPDSAAGRQLRAVVRARNQYGTEHTSTPLSGVVHTRPLNRVAPPLKSVYRVGAQLEAAPGEWLAIPNPTSTTYRFWHCNWEWLDCVAIGQGSGNSSIRLLPQHAGRWMKVQVTMTNWLGTTTAEGFGERVTAA